MIEQGRILIITTHNDVSLDYFIGSPGLKTDVLFYDDSLPRIKETLQNKYDYVYFRDPFNENGWQADRIALIADYVSSHQPQAYYVDKAQSYDDFLIEDKWRQYQLFADLMPVTSQITSFESIDYDTHLLKRRISSRGYGIVFSLAKVPGGAQPEDYIAQVKMDIEQEYRVFMIGGSIIKPIALRTSRAPGKATRTVGAEDSFVGGISEICEIIRERIDLDFAGIDIAQTSSGFKLLEINRSCQFKAYTRISGLNLADKLYGFISGETANRR